MEVRNQTITAPVLSTGTIFYDPFPPEISRSFTEISRSFIVPEQPPEQKQKEELIPVLISQNVSKGKLCTTVKWNDDTYTVVKLPQGEESSLYTAFCAALAKKLYGTNAKIHRMVDACDAARIAEQKQQQEREKKLAQKAKEKEIHRKKVAALVRKMRLKDEARWLYHGKNDDD